MANRTPRKRPAREPEIAWLTRQVRQPNFQEIMKRATDLVEALNRAMRDAEIGLERLRRIQVELVTALTFAVAAYRQKEAAE